MTIASLKALLAVITDAVNDIDDVFSSSALHPTPVASPSSPNPTSPPLPPTPTSPKTPCLPLDFPALDVPCSPSSPSEVLATTHPTVVQAVERIVAACGQMTCTVQNPFLALCDAAMGYHLPACLRILEASHTVEILRDADQAGIHVSEIATRVGMDSNKLGHILRLLATHHITREIAPDVFANNRISSLLDTGKDWRALVNGRVNKYNDTNGISAWVGMCTDEIFKSSAYMTEAYLLTNSTKYSREPTHTPFNFAFQTKKGFFGWLEEESENNESNRKADSEVDITQEMMKDNISRNKFRLERFGKAMTGTASFEPSGTISNALDWAGLPPGSIVVDVGGGIGSTTMLLAATYEHLQYVVQDREPVVEMGIKAWKTRCPDLLDSGRVKLQAYDFFTAQPVKRPSIFFLRVIMHDWPDEFARKILLRLREAAKEPGPCESEEQGTRLVLGDFVLPLACADDLGNESRTTLAGKKGEVAGAERMLGFPPLLANLGKGSAMAYWMDLCMQVMFNSQERTLREIIALASSAGWKVIRVTRSPGSLFGYIVAIPVPIPVQNRLRSGSGSVLLDAGTSKSNSEGGRGELETEGGSRCGTPTFGSRVDLPTFEEALARFRGVTSKRATRRGGSSTVSTAVHGAENVARESTISARKLEPNTTVKKNAPSQLSIRVPPRQIPTAPSSPAPPSARQTHTPMSPQSFRYHQQHQPRLASPTTLTRSSTHQRTPGSSTSSFTRPCQSPSSSQPFLQQLQQQLAPPPEIKSPRRTLQSTSPTRIAPPWRLREPEPGSPPFLPEDPPTPPHLLSTPKSPVSPAPSRRGPLPVLSRKWSSAALVSPPSSVPTSDARSRLRRTTSVVGMGVGGGVGMGSLFSLTSNEVEDGDRERSRKRDENSHGLGEGGTVLAAAAQIESGLRIKVRPARH